MENDVINLIPLQGFVLDHDLIGYSDVVTLSHFDKAKNSYFVSFKGKFYPVELSDFVVIQDSSKEHFDSCMSWDYWFKLGMYEVVCCGSFSNAENKKSYIEATKGNLGYSFILNKTHLSLQYAYSAETLKLEDMEELLNEGCLIPFAALINSVVSHGEEKEQKAISVVLVDCETTADGKIKFFAISSERDFSSGLCRTAFKPRPEDSFLWDENLFERLSSLQPVCFGDNGLMLKCDFEEVAEKHGLSAYEAYRNFATN